MQIRTRLVKLPAAMDLAVYLIREELKSTHFFTSLSRLGLDDCFYQASLAPPVLELMNLDASSDDVITFYLELIGEHSEQLEKNYASLTEAAMKVYWALRERQEEKVVPDLESQYC